MSTKTYRLNVKFFPTYPIGLQTTEVIARAKRKCSEQLAAFATELVAAGLSDGSYTQPVYNRLMGNYEFVVTNPRAAARIAEKYTSEVYVSKPGGRLFHFESYQSVPTWLFPEVTAEQRKLETLRYDVVHLIKHFMTITDDPDQLQLLKSIEINTLKATDINRLKAVQQRIQDHVVANPTWRWQRPAA